MYGNADQRYFSIVALVKKQVFMFVAVKVRNMSPLLRKMEYTTKINELLRLLLKVGDYRAY